MINKKNNKTIRRAAMVIYCQSVVIGALLGLVTILWGNCEKATCHHSGTQRKRDGAK